jgi:histidine triad (HIT) family protein
MARPGIPEPDGTGPAEAMTGPQGDPMNRPAPHCTFCDLIAGAAEVSICYEDATALAFLDIQPVNPGHILVVTRQHFESLRDLPHETAMHLFDVALRLEPVVRRLTSADGFNIVVNSGAAAGQDIFHYHVHLIPRAAGDGFDVPLPFPGSSMPDRTMLDATAVRIIAAMRDPMRGKGKVAAA